MLKEERHQYILNRINQNYRIYITSLSAEFILAEGSKLNTAEAYSVASLGDIDYLVTEDNKIEYIKQHWPKSSYVVM